MASRSKQLDHEIAEALTRTPRRAGTPLPPSPSSASHEGYVYHATNVERAHSIAESGLKPHGPSYGTDQREWPDGSRERRSYWITRAASAHSFAPEEGPWVLLRALRSQLDAKVERGTGDIVTTKTVPASKIEIVTDEGWEPLKSWAASRA